MKSSIFRNNYKTHRDTVLTLLTLLVIGILGFSWKQLVKDVTIEIHAKGVVEAPVRSPKPTEAPETPETYIIKVFGEVDGARGIKMLKECENHTLGLERINYNGDGTNDFGLWQINSVHGYTHEQLKDFKFNTDVAYKLYSRRGNKFSDWTCSYVIGDKSFWQ